MEIISKKYIINNRDSVDYNLKVKISDNNIKNITISISSNLAIYHGFQVFGDEEYYNPLFNKLLPTIKVKILDALNQNINLEEVILLIDKI